LVAVKGSLAKYSGLFYFIDYRKIAIALPENREDSVFLLNWWDEL